MLTSHELPIEPIRTNPALMLDVCSCRRGGDRKPKVVTEVALNCGELESAALSIRSDVVDRRAGKKGMRHAALPSRPNGPHGCGLASVSSMRPMTWEMSA
jgi:hypothetical protein